MAEADAQPQFLHKRQLEGIKTIYQQDWQGQKLGSLYLLEHSLADRTKPGVPVILIPGVFDPVKGEYAESMIMTLLSEPGISAVYEAHFRHEGTCGLINPEGVVDDICRIALRPAPKPILIGLSAGASAMAAGLLAAAQEKTELGITSALLIGPHLPTYQTIFVRTVERLFETQELLAKVARHAGHPYMPQNIERSLTWYQYSALKVMVDKVRRKDRHPDFPVPVSALYFKWDTTNVRGRRRLEWLLGGQQLPHTLPGVHRGLYRVPQAQAIIIDYCRQYTGVRMQSIRRSWFWRLRHRRQVVAEKS
jgi:hypothetical protein